ncbi:Magnesium transport protein CorA [Rosistilla oblonga]|uniref:Magnesium transport protein CorA n=2 Tax=Rosistilla TaxID=2795779 RepID=A0A518IN86_9BACT|nr:MULTISPECIES: magnesium/cobalt transporter CorA [Rosistilla]QDS86391.1 Magnesium transport protein CorA [Rosistilla ulvae]QDV10598.1 Magnesium transport protein CorA [Rosistilla oblonga]QDV54532.1 Magnesium transport protein CorA [Rosistilla oblonga]
MSLQAARNIMLESIDKLSKRMSRPRVVVGGIPGALESHPGSVKGQIRLIQYNEHSSTDKVVESVAELVDWVSHRKPPESYAGLAPTVPGNGATPAHARRTTWIDIDGVGDVAMLEELGKLFDIHPLAMEDVVNVHQHAKFEYYGDTMFFVARMPIDGGGFNTEQVGIFLIGDVVITIQERPGDCLEPVRHRIANAAGRIRERHSDYLAYSIIDAVIDGYFPLLDRYAEVLDDAAEVLQQGGDRSLPLQLHAIRADLLLIRKVVNQHRSAINVVLRDVGYRMEEDTALYFRDCQDHLQHLIEAADTDRETCAELRELYFAMLSERNNDVMKVLTIIATIFIPMSFVAGIYGMNFDSNVSEWNMPELQWTYGYPFALGLMTLMAGGLLAYLYRKGWLTK